MAKLKLAAFRYAYGCQKSGARRRGISFELAFEEWLKIWEDSEHLNERGKYRGQYVMARYGDKGPYAVGNVKIITVEENHSEGSKGWPKGKKFTDAHRNNISIAGKGRKATDITRRNMSEAKRGIKHSDAHKKNLSEACLGNSVRCYKGWETRRRRLAMKAD